MPIGFGGAGIHDDGFHSGSAKRGGASGVAPLDAGSLVPLANLGGITNTQIAAAAAIAKSKLAALGIVDADVAVGAAIAMSKLSLAITNTEIAAGAAIAHSKLAAGVAKISSGTYAGDATENRAIAHGLGVTPKLIYIQNDANQGGKWGIVIHPANTVFRMVYHGSAGSTNTGAAPTISDATNFYVGVAGTMEQTGNGIGGTYYWTAMS